MPARRKDANIASTWLISLDDIEVDCFAPTTMNMLETHYYLSKGNTKSEYRLLLLVQSVACDEGDVSPVMFIENTHTQVRTSNNE